MSTGGREGDSGTCAVHEPAGHLVDERLGVVELVGERAARRHDPRDLRTDPGRQRRHAGRGCWMTSGVAAPRVRISSVALDDDGAADVAEAVPDEVVHEVDELAQRLVGVCRATDPL